MDSLVASDGCARWSGVTQGDDTCGGITIAEGKAMIYDAEATSKFPPALRFDFLHGTTSCSRSVALAAQAGLYMAPLFSLCCGALYVALWPFNADNGVQDHDLATVLACRATLLSWQDIILQGKPNLDMNMNANTGLAALATATASTRPTSPCSRLHPCKSLAVYALGSAVARRG